MKAAQSHLRVEVSLLPGQDLVGGTGTGSDNVSSPHLSQVLKAV